MTVQQTWKFIYLTVTMVLDIHPPLTYDIHFDDDFSLGRVRLIEPADNQSDLPEGQPSAVQDGVWTKQHTFAVAGAGNGAHVVRYRLLKRELILEKVTINSGELRESYLGPPSSSYLEGSVSGRGYHLGKINTPTPRCLLELLFWYK